MEGFEEIYLPLWLDFKLEFLVIDSIGKEIAQIKKNTFIRTVEKISEEKIKEATSVWSDSNKIV